MRTVAFVQTAAFLIGIFAVDALASEFDGTNPFICAPAELASCEVGTECIPETAESINLPQFIRVDTNQSAITGKRPGGEELSTPILTKQHNDGRLVLQGNENGLSWTMSVHEAEGNMTIVAAGDKVAFMAFGACIRP